MSFLVGLMAIFPVVATFLGPSPARASEIQGETVVLLHGIARTGKSLRTLEAALQAQGYRTLAVTYPSTTEDLEAIAETLGRGDLNPEFWGTAQKVHFVTHSMGGLVAQKYLDRYRADISPEKMGRVVMLAPPNGGSEVADFLSALPAYQWIYGPAGQELTTAARAKDAHDLWYELGIIAGNKTWPYPVASFVVQGPGDGRVSVEKTKIDGMKDHITIDATHTFIMDRKDTHDLVSGFLKNGVFTHEK
ncbi:MAG: alpha/beta fold hydrolase [Rhodospirillales bacterium]|nr:alpha/beta fold hydrolase [Rhodospirillales bacterium]